ncbi:GNAT domain-containing protein [Paraphoma chrysanthemicola]|uniref:GNAT domain-containing protein n=1 Tax=Paraphoma chrysanthemicola TaxID=798071 RepID=A0A8K0R0B6_9PLEO|nr:GNAT domain-containing protein [Paraphoma chrysanthemicola]
MDSTITTQRLKLTLLTKADLGSQEFDWVHEIRSNVQSSWWSLYGAAKTPSDTEKAMKNLILDPQKDGEEKAFRIPYLVHELPNPTTSHAGTSSTEHGHAGGAPKFIGLISLRSLSPQETTEMPHLGHASTPTTLSLELAYMFLPTSWGRGYATESISAMLGACTRVDKSYWQPWEKVYVRAIVHDENTPSQRVCEKSLMRRGRDEVGAGEEEGKMEVLDFEGGRFFIAGKWRSHHRLYVYGREIVG